MYVNFVVVLTLQINFNLSYKNGANLLMCIELFIMGKLIISLILHEFVYVLDDVYMNLIP